jgi:hypothetical protein
MSKHDLFHEGLANRLCRGAVAGLFLQDLLLFRSEVFRRPFRIFLGLCANFADRPVLAQLGFIDCFCLPIYLIDRNDSESGSLMDLNNLDDVLGRHLVLCLVKFFTSRACDSKPDHFSHNISLHAHESFDA